MKAVLTIIGFIVILCITFGVAIGSLDRHMYQGVDVVKQEGSVLFVTLDDQYKLGTDGVCLAATRMLANVALQSGFKLQVVPEKDEWVPFNNRVVSHSDLVNIIESGAPY